jgi:signal transduction histidine kinase/CheY-like chemotaxis protein
VLDPAGEVAYLVHSVVDVTDLLRSEQRKEAAEQKATELQLLYSELLLAQHKVQQSEAYFRALTTATSDVIYRMSADWAQMRELDGRQFLADTGEPIDNWVEKYLYPQDQHQVLQVIQEAIQTKSIFQFEHQVKRADGTAGWTFSRAIPILDQQGEIVEWFGAASDITEQKQAKELEYQYRGAQEANRLRSQFLSTMSHELRTPLAAIIGFSQLLLDDAAAQQLSEQQRVNLQRILKNGQHLLGLVSDVLDLEKIDAGRMEITYEPVDIRELLTSVVEETQAMALERHLLLRAEVEEGVDLLESNAVKLRQILLNLVSNALKYSDQGEVLVLARRRPATGEQPDAVVLAVKDTGIGIPPEVQARVFEAFYQVEGGYTRKVGGTGLGLAITSRLTTLLGGTIELESAPGRGSTFTVTLPTKAMPLPEAKQMPRLHPAQETPAVRPAASTLERAMGVAQLEAAPGQPPLVLAVDDNPDVIVLLKDALKESPYRVVGVQDPTRVMELVQQMRPSAITLDVLMDDTNGWQILDQLKRNPATASIPVVMLTVISEPSTGYVLGADDYLVKPFKKETLLTTLQKVMVSQKERSGARERVAHAVSTRSP